MLNLFTGIILDLKKSFEDLKQWYPKVSTPLSLPPHTLIVQSRGKNHALKEFDLLEKLLKC
jgi:hypothetical protein